MTSLDQAVVVVALGAAFVLQAIQYRRIGTPSFWVLQPFVWAAIGIAFGVLIGGSQP